jgi:hypothetical protein
MTPVGMEKKIKKKIEEERRREKTKKFNLSMKEKCIVNN